jgi:metallophosphoesterase superfamily enzyme
MRVHTDWLLTPQRAAIHLPTATAVVADLHFGYNHVRCRDGEALPPADPNETFAALGVLRWEHDVRRLVIAGDLFEDARSVGPVDEFLSGLRTVGMELWGVVPGNHDRGLHRAADRVPLYANGILLGDWRVVHGDGICPSIQLVQGHLHPWLRWDGRISAPCYLIGPNRLILPAFSLDAAGVNVLRGRDWSAYRCAVIAGQQVLDFGEVSKLRKQRQELV